MKNLRFFRAVAILLLPGFMYAQQTPQFQITLQFEDAIGNKDSIIVGYDETASSDQLNTQFGEVLIDTPFDSVFEVRAMHGDVNQPLETSKIIIGHLETSSGNSCGAMEFIRIMINSESLVTLDFGETVAEAQIALCDLSGRRLRHFSSFQQQAIPINLDGLSAGIYFIGVSTDQSSKPVYYKLIRH